MRMVAAGVVGCMLLVSPSIGQSPAPQSGASHPPKESNKNPAQPDSPELAILGRFAGPWDVSESHYNSRGEVVGSAKGIEEGSWTLDGRVMQRIYTSGVEGSLFRAIGLIAWDAVEKQFEGTWFDNVSTNGPTSLSGTWDEEAKTMTFTLTSTGPDGKPVNHKVIDRFLDEEHRIATTYKVIGNQVEKVIEVQFKRARPCPTNIGVIRESTKKD